MKVSLSLWVTQKRKFPISEQNKIRGWITEKKEFRRAISFFWQFT